MSLLKLFHKIGTNVGNSFRYRYGLNYVLACVLTYLIVIFGLDLIWYRFALANLWIWQVGFVSVGAGFFVPLFLPPLLYVYGRVYKLFSIQIAGLAMEQAAILGFLISSSMKVFTGRIPPEYVGRIMGFGGFRFGFWQGGAFNGWPSSHTTVAFAVAMGLIELYPGNTAIKIGAWAFALLVGLGVSTNIHWFSDVVAGALIGYAIGKTVGARFSKDFKKI
jgi:membrane-associated phospholipid phosphatase